VVPTDGGYQSRRDENSCIHRALPEKNQELTASLLFRPALQSFQGAVLMAERR
jgi:hypothetical protein